MIMFVFRYPIAQTQSLRQAIRGDRNAKYNYNKIAAS